MDNSDRKNPLDRVIVPPSAKQQGELRSLLRGQTRMPESPASPGVMRQLDSRLTQYDGGSNQTISEIQEMLDRNPNNESLLDWLAFMMYTNERYGESISLYNRLLELNQDNVTAHYYSANCYFKMGHTDKAIVEWRRAMVLAPNGKIARKAAARVDMAKAKLASKV